MKFSEGVYGLCKLIPKGRVSTYGKIAHTLNTKAYQAIGQILSKNSTPIIIPCHRIVKSDGSLGGFKGKSSGKEIQEKIKLLKKEGIKIKNNKIIDLEKVLYKF